MSGFDDEKGDYKIITNDHISYRYEILGYFDLPLQCHFHHGIPYSVTNPFPLFFLVYLVKVLLDKLLRHMTTNLVGM